MTMTKCHPMTSVILTSMNILISIEWLLFRFWTLSRIQSHILCKTLISLNRFRCQTTPLQPTSKNSTQLSTFKKFEAVSSAAKSPRGKKPLKTQKTSKLCRSKAKIPFSGKTCHFQPKVVFYRKSKTECLTVIESWVPSVRFRTPQKKLKTHMARRKWRLWDLKSSPLRRRRSIALSIGTSVVPANLPETMSSENYGSKMKNRINSYRLSVILELGSIWAMRKVRKT